jgi:hypothetical protein
VAFFPSEVTPESPSCGAPSPRRSRPAAIIAAAPSTRTRISACLLERRVERHSPPEVLRGLAQVTHGRQRDSRSLCAAAEFGMTLTAAKTVAASANRRWSRSRVELALRAAVARCELHGTAQVAHRLRHVAACGSAVPIGWASTESARRFRASWKRPRRLKGPGVEASRHHIVDGVGINHGAMRFRGFGALRTPGSSVRPSRMGTSSGVRSVCPTCHERRRPFPLETPWTPARGCGQLEDRRGDAARPEPMAERTPYS